MFFFLENVVEFENSSSNEEMLLFDISLDTCFHDIFRFAPCVLWKPNQAMLEYCTFWHIIGHICWIVLHWFLSREWLNYNRLCDFLFFLTGFKIGSHSNIGHKIPNIVILHNFFKKNVVFTVFWLLFVVVEGHFRQNNCKFIYFQPSTVKIQ